MADEGATQATASQPTATSDGGDAAVAPLAPVTPSPNATPQTQTQTQPRVTRNRNVTTIRLPTATTSGDQTVRQFRLDPNTSQGPIRLDLGHGQVVTLDSLGANVRGGRITRRNRVVNGATPNVGQQTIRIHVPQGQTNAAPGVASATAAANVNATTSVATGVATSAATSATSNAATSPNVSTNNNAATATATASVGGGSSPGSNININGNVISNAIRRALNTTTTNTNNNNNNNNAHTNQRSQPPLQRQLRQPQMNVRVVQIPNLVPQPIHIHPSQAGTHEQDDDKFARFKCLICSDFMRSPSGCGKCSSRFCHGCLLRVVDGANTSSRRDNNTDGQNAADNKPVAKCPTCRVEFSADDIAKDEVLQKQMHEMPAISCRYPNCTEKHRLHLISDHEKKCSRAPCKCRYATFGCNWQGPRGDVTDHEKVGCIHAKMAPVIEQLRHVKIDHTNRIDILQQQIAGTMRMQTVQQQNLQRIQAKSVYNVVDFMEYCQVATCTTASLFRSRERWVAFHGSRGSCAGLVNTLTLLPTMLVWATVSLDGYHDFIALIHRIDMMQSTEEELTVLFEQVLLSIMVLMMGVMILTGSLSDSRSSLKYIVVSSQWLNIAGYPLVRDAVAMSVLGIHYRTWLFGEVFWMPCIIQWFLVTITSTFFPGLVWTVSNAVNGIPVSSTTIQLEELGRAVEPVLFGLRYALLGLNFHWSTCLDAIGLMVITKHVLTKIYPDMVTGDCFCDELPASTVLFFMSARVVIFSWHIKMTIEMDQTFDEMMMVDTLVAFSILLLVNILLKKLTVLGVIVGKKIVQQAQIAMRREGLRNDEYTGLGISVFGTWAATLFAIVTTTT